jgi:hypothetical protein
MGIQYVPQGGTHLLARRAGRFIGRLTERLWRFRSGVADVNYKVWAGDGRKAIGYVLNSRNRSKRWEMTRGGPGAMQECIATFEADSWDGATVLYEDPAGTWEAKNSDPE